VRNARGKRTEFNTKKPPRASDFFTADKGGPDGATGGAGASGCTHSFSASAAHGVFFRLSAQAWAWGPGLAFPVLGGSQAWASRARRLDSFSAPAGAGGVGRRAGGRAIGWRRFLGGFRGFVNDLGSSPLRGGASCASSAFLCRWSGVARSRKNIIVRDPRGPASLGFRGPTFYGGAVLRRGPLRGGENGDMCRRLRAVPVPVAHSSEGGGARRVPGRAWFGPQGFGSVRARVQGGLRSGAGSGSGFAAASACADCAAATISVILRGENDRLLHLTGLAAEGKDITSKPAMSPKVDPRQRCMGPCAYLPACAPVPSNFWRGSVTRQCLLVSHCLNAPLISMIDA